MTRAMWFAWLLRSDVRAGASLTDAEAQRDFVAWWLVAAGREYPATWWYGPAQVDVAMEPVAMVGRPWPRLLRYLWRTRPDLQAAFPVAAEECDAGFFAWYRLYGPSEACAAPPLPADILAMTEAPMPIPTGGAPTSTRLRATMSWIVAALAGLNRDVATRLPVAERRTLTETYLAGGWARLPLPHSPPASEEPAPDARLSLAALRRRAGAQGIGVNLCGYARAEFGIGEDVRAMSASLDVAGVPHVVLDATRAGNARQQDATLAPRIVTQPRYPVTIFCMTPFDTARLYLEQGAGFFAGTYRIGSWAWELPEVPAVLDEAFTLVDEVWAHSRYSAEAFTRRSLRQVHFMPPSVVLPEGCLQRRRRMKGAPFTFICAFDPNSYLSRKNPLAAVEAFSQAFPTGDRSVALVLRVNGIPEGQPGWADLATAAALDDRIRVMTGTLARVDALRLLAGSDCLVSPHRAEGFGRNIAEAIMLGVPVIATGFSGCVDFLEAGEGVAWTPVPIQPDDYPFGEGLWWADPDLDALAERMRAVQQGGLRAPRQAALARRVAQVREQCAVGAVGRGYADRLKALFKPSLR